MMLTAATARIKKSLLTGVEIFISISYCSTELLYQLLGVSICNSATLMSECFLKC